MRLLVIGSVLVLCSVVGWAATKWTIDKLMTPRLVPAPPVYRYVNADGSGKTSAAVWHTSTGPNDCEVLRERLARGETDTLAMLMSSSTTDSGLVAPANLCSLFQAGEAERGAKVEVIDACGSMARVRILSGPLEGSRGCMANEVLSEAAPG